MQSKCFNLNIQEILNNRQFTKLEQKLYIILFKNNVFTTLHTLPIAATKLFSVPTNWFVCFLSP